MKRLAFLLFFLSGVFVIPTKIFAQNYFYNNSYYDNPVNTEIGLSAGMMNCLTDLGGKEGIGEKFIKDLNYGKNASCYGLYGSMLYRDAIGIRMEACFGKISADDAVLSSVPVNDIARARFNRNLSFKSNITELSLLTEIHPLFLFVNRENAENDPPRISPFITGGIGFFSFNPQGKLGNRWVDLQPLRTEGQGLKEYPDRTPYKLKQFNFPVGAGIKYELSPLVNVRAELIYRILTTDYLDDCSTTYIDPSYYALNGFTGVKLSNALSLNDRQINKVAGAGGKRGSPTQKDGYFSFNIKIGLVLRERAR